MPLDLRHVKQIDKKFQNMLDSSELSLVETRETGLIDDYQGAMRRRGLTPRSIERYTCQLRAFDRWMTPAGICAASAEDIEIFLDARRSPDGLHPIVNRTRYGWISTLHRFSEWAMRRGHADDDPTLDIDRPRMRVGVPRPVTDDGKNAAIAAAPRDIRAMLVLGAYCGLRVAEVAELTRDAVLEDTMNLRVLGKGQKERIVPMPPIVLRSLTSHGLPRSGHIFHRPRGGPWPPSRLSRRLVEYLAEVNVDATFHQFRHWYGTRTYAECRDLLLVQYLMGHSSSTTTAVYVAFSRTGAAETVAALPGAA